MGTTGTSAPRGLWGELTLLQTSLIPLLQVRKRRSGRGLGSVTCYNWRTPPLLTGEVQVQWEEPGECHMLHLADHVGVPQFLSNIDGGSLGVGPIQVLIQL
ncbi:hypothetical protein XELAEV_18011233mg [Xenopus laevis]|uniref:Uncharacterized protein n=1 Tax=Xenopus laevis TaxID=8355 RepID=A0A974DLX1_XENLA|nr:hypothetical protein XELAEV_18011233mg [Xenopus laevis]